MRSLIEGLPDYERMMSRSVALWREAIGEIEREGLGGMHVTILADKLEALRHELPADPGPLRAPDLFQELERELDHLHKRLVHAMPDRAYAHERCRILEQLLADLKAHALR